jgi:hypothetical protein
VPSKAELEVEIFNLRYPVGTKVSYWTGAREGEGRRGRTTYPAQLHAKDTPVVYLRDLNGNNVGAVALSHVERAPEPKSNLLTMAPLKEPVPYHYEPNDLELRGAENLLCRAALHLDKAYWRGKKWDTDAHCDAYCVLKVLYEDAERLLRDRKANAAYVAPEVPEVVQ